GVHERPTLAVAAALRLDGTTGAGRNGRDRIVEARVAVGCVSLKPVRMAAAEARLTDLSIGDLDDAARAAADAAAAGVGPVDGLAVSACTYLAVEADGRSVLTVEGLADGESLHPLQRAFVEAGAVQCGFCTSGMLLTAKAMLAENRTPTRDDVLHYLRGSLCRCTGYRKIVDAVLAAAETAR